MGIGVPRERRSDEYRVGLTPAGVDALTRAGRTVYVEHHAGLSAGFGNQEYEAGGAQIAYTPEEVWRRARTIVKVAPPTAEEQPWFDGQTLISFLHLAVAPNALVQALQEARVTAIAGEMIQSDDGTFPVLHPTSEVAGRMAPIIAGSLLETGTPRNSHTLPVGRGVLLSGLPGIPPANVVILGGGVVGGNAARSFLGLGAQVTVLDTDAHRLRTLDDRLAGRVVTMLATPHSISKAISYADVLIGAVYVPGQHAPQLVSRAMVRAMRSRAVIIDFAIDQGGCVETSRPTTHADPIFLEEDVIHYCVPNVPARVARTASHAWTNAILPYVSAIADLGIEDALAASPALRRGVAVHAGRIAEAGANR